MRAKAFAAVLMLTLGACVAAGPEAITTAVLSSDPIERIESRVVLPEGAQRLDAYDRYYATDQIGGREIIHGVYLLRRSFGHSQRDGMAPVAGRAGAFRGVADDLPLVTDGGCAVINLYFDVVLDDFLLLHEEGTNRPLSQAVCNGLA